MGHEAAATNTIENTDLVAALQDLAAGLHRRVTLCEELAAAAETKALPGMSDMAPSNDLIRLQAKGVTYKHAAVLLEDVLERMT